MQLQRLELVYPFFLARRAHLENRLGSWGIYWRCRNENAMRLAMYQVSQL
jgi:hypothetical protein